MTLPQRDVDSAAAKLFRISRKHPSIAAVPACRHNRSKLPLNSSSPSITKGGNASAVAWLNLFDHGVDLLALVLRFATSSLVG
jgi:hypothetical protein